MTLPVLRGALVLATAFLATTPSSASAHRDGCHRWHSCPSDTGSYVCGDLGYYTYCGGDTETEPDVPAVTYDYTAPDTPVLATATVVAGMVSLPVTAERGSRIEVAVDGTVVARATGSGSRQTVRFRGLDGTRTYVVTTADAAGNESYSGAEVTLTVDATAPEVASVVPAAPGMNGAYTTVWITGEDNARYTLRVFAGAAPVSGLGRSGTLGAGGRASERLLLRNGTYAVEVALRDSGGNVSRTRHVPLRVAVPAPRLALVRTSAQNEPLEVRVTGPVLGKGAVYFAAAGQPRERVELALDGTGVASVSVSVADGSWNVTATVADFQHRRASARLGALTVDRLAPELTVGFDRTAAARGEIRLDVVTEPGATTTVAGLPGPDTTYPEGGTHRIAMRAKDGTYSAHVESVDAAGNRTQRDLRVAVSHPMTLAELVVGMLGLLILLGGAGGTGWFAWRRREGLANWYWARRAARATKAANLRHSTALAAHARAMAAYNAARDAHQSAHRQWQVAGAQLAAAVDEADGFTGTDDAFPDGVKPKPGERVYTVLPRGALVEMRRPNGVDTPTLVERGTVLVTSDGSSSSVRSAANGRTRDCS